MALFPGLSLAQETSGSPQIFAGLAASATYDSNVTRAPQSPAAVGSWIERLALVGGYDRSFDRQRFYGSVDIGMDRYSDMPLYNSTVEKLRLGLASTFPLGITTDIHGTHSVQLANQADFASVQRNLLTENGVEASGQFPVLAQWKAVVIGGLSHDSNSNGLDQVMNSSNSIVAGGLRYQTGQDNYIELLHRDTRTNYPSPGAQAAALASSRAQFEEFKTRWRFSGASEVIGRAGYERDQYSNYSFRNFSGPAYDLSYLWTPGARLKLTFYGARAVGVPGDNAYLSAATRTLRLTPSYLATEKLTLESHYEISHVSYNGDLQLLQIGQAPALARDDTQIQAGIGAQWRPRDWLRVHADVSMEQRASTITSWDYHTHIVGLRAEARF